MLLTECDKTQEVTGIQFLVRLLRNIFLINLLARSNARAYLLTNNIATGMVRARHKYAFNPPKYAFD
jgi:hypothetical protein